MSEIRRPLRFCVDTNIIYNLAVVTMLDKPFFVEKTEEGLRYHPIRDDETLSDLTSDLSSDELSKYVKENNLKLTTLATLVRQGVLHSDIFKDCDYGALPPIIRDVYLGATSKFKEDYGQYYRIELFTKIIDAAKAGEVQLFYSFVVATELFYAISNRTTYGQMFKEFFRAHNNDIVKMIVFENKNEELEFRSQADMLLQKYKKDKDIKSAHLDGMGIKEIADLTAMAESTALNLDLITCNTEHLIGPVIPGSRANDYTISNAFERINVASGYLHPIVNFRGLKISGIKARTLSSAVTLIEAHREAPELMHSGTQGDRDFRILSNGVVSKQKTAEETDNLISNILGNIYKVGSDSLTQRDYDSEVDPFNKKGHVQEQSFKRMRGQLGCYGNKLADKAKRQKMLEEADHIKKDEKRNEKKDKKNKKKSRQHLRREDENIAWQQTDDLDPNAV